MWKTIMAALRFRGLPTHYLQTVLSIQLMLFFVNIFLITLVILQAKLLYRVGCVNLVRSCWDAMYEQASGWSRTYTITFVIQIIRGAPSVRHQASSGSVTSGDSGYGTSDVPPHPIQFTSVTFKEGSASQPTSTPLPQQEIAEETPVPRRYLSNNKHIPTHLESSWILHSSVEADCGSKEELSLVLPSFINHY